MPPPSLRALRAFAETARTGSLAGASRGLNVTPSAVSHLLRQLEQSLAVTLFTTSGPQAHLTETGHQLGRRLITAFDSINAAVIEARHKAGDVRVSALSSFLTLWLVPRLSSFQTRHPELTLLFSTGTRPVDLAAEPYDCAIRWGQGGWPGLEATMLFRDHPVVVTNPRLLSGSAHPSALPRLAAATRPGDWPLVSTALGWLEKPKILTFETRAQAVQAAISGLGATVVDRNLVTDALAAGILVEFAPNPPVPVVEGHWFVALPSRLRARQVQRFRDWLTTQAGNQPECQPLAPESSIAAPSVPASGAALP